LKLDFGRDGIRAVDLPNTTEKAYKAIEQFVLRRINEAGCKSREAIADAFEFAVRKCPKENPSDLWHHVLYRIYIREKQATDPGQSWVRTSGEDFELALTRVYNPRLAKFGIRLLPLFKRLTRSLAS
jgi:hypothetical protein